MCVCITFILDTLLTHRYHIVGGNDDSDDERGDGKGGDCGDGEGGEGGEGGDSDGDEGPNIVGAKGEGGGSYADRVLAAKGGEWVKDPNRRTESNVAATGFKDVDMMGQRLEVGGYILNRM